MPTMNTIKLSIIIVTYNASLTIERVLDNIIHNKTEETELIVIDGQSTDDSLQKIDKYKIPLEIHPDITYTVKIIAIFAAISFLEGLITTGYC